MKLISLVALALAAQNAAPQNAEPAITNLDQLPIGQATAVRCGVAFAVVEGWQERSDPRGDEWPNIVGGGGREFFVRAAAQLMDERGLDRDAFAALVQTEVLRMLEDEGEPARAIMPACLLLLDTPPN